MTSLASDALPTQIEILDEGRVVATAEMSEDGPDCMRASLHAASDHLPPGTRSSLIDAVLDDPQVRRAGHVSASVPKGDAESLIRVQERCTDVQTRSAGASVLVEADVPPAAESAG